MFVRYVMEKLYMEAIVKMPENILSTLLNQRAELSGQKSEIEKQLEEVETKIKVYMDKNGLYKAENEYYKVSMRDDTDVTWIDKDAGREYLLKQGILSKFMKESLDPHALKKYLLETGETLGGNLELSPTKKITISTKKG